MKKAMLSFLEKMLAKKDNKIALTSMEDYLNITNSLPTHFKCEFMSEDSETVFMLIENFSDKIYNCLDREKAIVAGDRISIVTKNMSKCDAILLFMKLILEEV